MNKKFIRVLGLGVGLFLAGSLSVNAQKGKVYLTTIDKNLQYMGEQPLKKLQLPARSVATIVVEDN